MGTGIHFGQVYQFLSQGDWENKVVVLSRPEFHNKDEIWKNREKLDGSKVELIVSDLSK